MIMYNGTAKAYVSIQTHNVDTDKQDALHCNFPKKHLEKTLSVRFWSPFVKGLTVCQKWSKSITEDGKQN